MKGTTMCPICGKPVTDQPYQEVTVRTIVPHTFQVHLSCADAVLKAVLELVDEIERRGK